MQTNEIKLTRRQLEVLLDTAGIRKMSAAAYYGRAQDADAWSRHDTEKFVSFFDPAFVFVAPDGKRTPYTEWRQNLPASLAQARHSQVRTTLKGPARARRRLYGVD
jgi:hypothetical protein